MQKTIFGFLLGGGLVFAAALFFSSTEFSGGGNLATIRFGSHGISLPDAMTAKDIADPELARKNGFFWVRGRPHQGAAIRLLENADLFESVFPGYRAALNDRTFWRGYFREPVDQLVYSPMLMRGEGLLRVGASSLGNSSLFRRYGADALILGNSETFTSVPPGLLSDVLRGSAPAAGSELKIVNIGFAAMRGREALSRAKALATSGRRAKIILWGYSLSNAYRDDASDTPQTVDERSSDSVFQWGLHSLFPAASWDHMTSFSVQEAWRRNHPDIESLDRPITVSRRVAADPLALAQTVARASADTRSFYERESNLSGLTDRLCDLKGPSRQLDQTLEELLKTGDRIAVFLTPVTPLQSDFAPDCFVRGIRALLKSRSGPRVIVNTGDWRDYGLTYADFLWPDRNPELLDVNANHVNYSGAAKVTAKIGRWLREEDSRARSQP